MKEVNRFSYIYFAQCPIDHSVKYISTGITPKTPLIIAQSFLFKSWKADLKKAKLKPIISIIDKVNQEEEDFWLTHYQDLFQSWGFNLWTKDIEDYINEASRINVFELKHFLCSAVDESKLSRKVLNLEIFVRLVKILLRDAYRLKEIDDFTLITFLIFFYGMSLSEISKLKITDLWAFHKSLHFGIDLCRFIKIENFIHNYAVIHLKHVDRKSNDVKVLKKTPSATEYNSRLFLILNYFGFNQHFNYHDRDLISKLLMFRTNAVSDLDKRILEKVFQTQIKQILYELINRTKSKYLIITEDSRVYRDVLTYDE